MMKMIRENFPNSFIWVVHRTIQTFWQKMVDSGYVNQIGNDYSWRALIRGVGMSSK